MSEARLNKLEALVRMLGAKLATRDQSGVTSVFGRTGAVTAQNDYSAFYATTNDFTDHDTRHSPGGADTLSGYYATTNAFNDHDARHAPGGADPLDAFYAITLRALDTFGATTDITTLNSSTSAHGLLPKLDGTTTNFLRGDGTWAAPGGGGVWSEIAEASPTSGTNLSFSGIATGYTQFWLTGYIQMANTGDGDLTMQFNNDTAANYLFQNVRGGYAGAPTSVTSTSSSSITWAACTSTGNKVLVFNCWITNHSTGEPKLTVYQTGAFNGGTNIGSLHGMGQWNNTADEISEIDIDLTGTGAAFVAGSRIWLLGRTN